MDAYTTFDELMIKQLREASGSEAFLMSFCPLSKAPLNNFSPNMTM